MTTHEGKCEGCRILWVWNINRTLAQQTCLCCGAALTRANTAAQAEFTALNYEGYGG